MDYTVNLNALTFEAIGSILDLDKTFVGTENYIGVAYFWGHEYRYPMRDASIATRRSVHSKMLKAGLEVNACSPAHDEIIEWATKRTYK